MNRSLVFVGMAAIILISVLCVLLARSNAALATSESDNRVLRSDNALQTAVITTQAFNFNRFNQIAENTNRLNSLIDAGTEKTIIEYREILRREKNCDLPVPADVAGGLLEYAHRLRANAMHPDIDVFCARGLKLTAEEWAQAGRLIAAGESRKRLAIIYDVGVSTLYKKLPARC